MRIAVLGLGSWGTAMAGRLAAGGHEVRGWARDPVQRDALRMRRENQKYLPGFKFPDLLHVVDSVRDAASGADWVVLAVPSHAVRSMAARLRDEAPGLPVVNLAKGLEERTHRRMLEVIAEELGADRPAASLVGPSHAEEVALDHPTAVVATSWDAVFAVAVQEAFTDAVFRVYTNPDTVGVEVAVALKNVIALAAGISAGLGYGDNSLGSLITRGLAEMTRLGKKLGGRPETFFGLAGVGDLVTTCASKHSRNRRLGESIGQGRPVAEAMAAMTMVVEGVRTTAAAWELAQEHGVEMPIVEQVHAVLFGGTGPREALRDLMAREPRPEPESRGTP